MLVRNNVPIIQQRFSVTPLDVLVDSYIQHVPLRVKDSSYTQYPIPECSHLYPMTFSKAPLLAKVSHTPKGRTTVPFA